MQPLILPPGFVEGVRSYSTGGVGGAYVNGSQSVRIGSGQFRGPGARPPMPWDGARPGFSQAVQDWINGGRLANASVALGTAALSQLAQFLAQFQKEAEQAAGNLWDWLNRPKGPDGNNQWPGLAPGQVVSITKSPRAVGYSVTGTGLHPASGSYYPWSGYLQYYPFNNNPFPEGTTRFILDSVSIEEEDMGELWGRKCCHFIVTLQGRTSSGVSGQTRSSYQLATGTGNVTVTPAEMDQSGWTTTTTTVPPLPWGTALPARAPAQPVALPALFPALPPIAPSQPGTMPPDLAETVGDKAQAPPFLWNGAVAVGQGTASEPQAPMVPGHWPAYLPPVVGSVPITAAGTVAQPKPRPPATTPADSHFVNGVEIGGSTGRATLEAIAAEVTRIEGKTARLLRNPDPSNGPGDMIDRIADMLTLLAWLQDLLSLDVPGRKVTITAPCNKDANGNPLKVERQFPEADFLPALLERLDFLIDATKETTGWRRPTCKLGTTANVTIKAIEIDPR